jgi:hypothetical protein
MMRGSIASFIIPISLLLAWSPSIFAWSSNFPPTLSFHRKGGLIGEVSVSRLDALSDKFLENDLVSIQVGKNSAPRFCVVTSDATVAPLCRHEDDVETDLYVDPRCSYDKVWEEVSDDAVKGTYGEGWFGQRPVPSLGGGPGYGAPAHDIWSIDEDLLENLENDGVELPILDVGIAHGEQARGGAF